MNSDDFSLVSDLLRERSGLVLSPEKAYLLDSRLTPVARRRGANDVKGLIAELRQSRDEKLIREITETMTTNETFFFRDNAPFTHFEHHVLPELLELRRHRRNLRIWCAAGSTGQEPYSIAMILKEHEAKLKGWNIEIISTDLSSRALEKAKVGLYSQFEVQRGLPIQFLVKYFSEVGEMWQIDPAIRDMVTFRQFNLLDRFTVLGSFDVIFCRNVLIYFDQDTKADVLHRLAEIMPRHGVLFLGAAETVLGICPKFRPVSDKRGMYVMAGEDSIRKPAPALKTATE